MTLPNLVAAIAATAGLYLLARAMPAIQAIAGDAARRRRRWAGWLARGAVDAVAFVLPRVDAATRTEWLVYDAPAARRVRRGARRRSRSTSCCWPPPACSTSTAASA